MGQYVKNLTQNFVYWEFDGADEVGGVKVKSPVDIKGRRDDEAQVVQGRNGETLVSAASIIIDRPVLEKSYIWLGTVAELISPTIDPQTMEDAYCIAIYEETLSTNGIMKISKARINKRV